MTETLRNMIMSTEDADAGFKLLQEHEKELSFEDKKMIYSAVKGSELSEEDLDGIVGGNIFDTVAGWFLPKSVVDFSNKLAKQQGYSSMGESTWEGIKKAASDTWSIIKNTFKPKNTIDGAVGYF